MLNQIILVGKLVKIPELKENENGKKFSVVTVAVPRSFKNMNGEYETDIIECISFDSVASATVEYCQKGDVVGVKGRVQSKISDKECKLEIIAEKVTFLSQAKKVEDTEVGGE